MTTLSSRKLAAALTVLVFALAVQHPAVAANNNYIGTNDGNWNVPANWSQNRVPGGGNNADDVFIRDNLGVIVNSDVVPVGSGTVLSVALGQYTVAGGATSGTLTIQNAGTLLVSGDVQVMRRASGLVGVTGNLTMTGGSLTANGTIFVGAGQSGNTGNGTGTLDLSGFSILTGAISVGSPTADRGTGFMNLNGSNLTVGDGGSAKVFTLNATAKITFTLDASGASLLNYAASTVQFVSGSSLTIDGAAYTGMGGTIKLIDSLSLTGSPTTVNILNFAGQYGSPTVSIVNNDVFLNLATVPEPSVVALLIVFGTCVFALKRFSSRKSARESRMALS